MPWIMQTTAAQIGIMIPCLNFIDMTTYFWTFSTLAQVFGALLALIGIFVIFTLERFEKAIDDQLNRIKKYERQGTDEEVRKTMSGSFQSLKNTREEYVKRSIFTLWLIALALVSSLIALNLSSYLGENNIHWVFILFGILFPLFVIYAVVCFISSSFPVRYLMTNILGEPMFKWWQFWKCRRRI